MSNLTTTIDVTYWYLPTQDSIVEVTHKASPLLGDLYEYHGGFPVNYMSPCQIDLLIPNAIQLD